MDRITQFFSSNFMMPHGYCFLWLPEIVWLHVLSDIIIALAYFSIPIALYSFAKRRRDLPFRMLFHLFAAFITLCGLTHVFGIIVLWYPYYGIEGIVKLITGVVSATTAVIIWKKWPLALKLPSPAALQKMNDELKNINATVEKKVQQRTEELKQLNEELQRAYKAAKEANASKSDFLASISHELRTPMNAIIGVSHILDRSEKTPQEQKEFISTLRLSANSLLNLINNLLDISKIEAHGLELESIDFNLADLLKEVHSIMHIRAQEKGIQLDVKYTNQETLYCKGDAMRIKQILLNLTSNAIKFTDSGYVSLGARQETVDGKRHYVLTVKDTGIGMTPQQAEKIFDKFTQADASITRKYGGSGLGLAITRQLVEVMGGHIQVDSQPGLGSTFTVRLPLEPAAATHPARKGHASAGQAAKRRAIAESNKRVLLAEDYQANVLVAKTLLENMGYTVVVVENGRDAVHRLEHEAFDIVLMDVQMPVMDGFEATRTIKRFQKEGRIPDKIKVIGMTAYALAGDREKCLAAGMDDYISKPFEPEQLENALLKYAA